MPKKMFSARVDPVVIKTLKKAAKEQDRTPSWMAEHLLKIGLGLKVETATAEQKEERAA